MGLITRFSSHCCASWAGAWRLIAQEARWRDQSMNTITATKEIEMMMSAQMSNSRRSLSGVRK